ncbi:TPA: hypothetical protein ACKPXW_000256 [Serratia marcescens]
MDNKLSKPVAWLAIYHGEVYDEAISITRSVVEAQAERFGWESALTEIIPLYRHAPPAPAVPDDYFGELVKKARSAADKAMRKFPQPNYVLNKVAEESGEVIKAVIHFTEGREEWANVEGEIIDNLAMLIRLVVEGDQVIGFTPPVACHGAILPAPHDPDPIDVFVAQVCGDLSAGHQR